MKYNLKAKAESKMKSKLKSTTTVPISITIYELEKMKMRNNRQLAENGCYEWYDWLLNHISESLTKSVNNNNRGKWVNLGQASLREPIKKVQKLLIVITFFYTINFSLLHGQT